MPWEIPVPESTMATACGGGDWTIVCGRGRRRGNASRTASHTKASLCHPVTPVPWSPSDPCVDLSGVSGIIARTNTAISRVADSQLYRRLLLNSPLRRRIALLRPTRLSLLGVGTFESSPAARLQLALTVLLRRDLLPNSVAADLFDPVLSATECAAAAALGFSVPSMNDGCRRHVAEPTLFYMPHCEVALYDALLTANWESPAQLRCFCVLGNSFRKYALQVEENRTGPAAKAAAKAPHLLAAQRFAWEERIDDVGDSDEDGWLHRAFGETSWHFFEVKEGVDLAATIAPIGGMEAKFKS